MTRIDPLVPDSAAVSELKAYLRIGFDEDDALLGRLLCAAIGHGEAVTGQMFVARGVSETVRACSDWSRLSRGPVGAITGVAAGDTALAVDAYAIDIDAGGDGWVRLTAASDAETLTVTYTAGLATAWTGLPEPLRQGALRLASHLYTHRDAADESVPPAVIVALWRPWRRMRIL